MSFLVTRPAKPVPGTVLMSTLCSAAIFRTSGVDLRRRRSSAVSAAPLPPALSPAPLASAAGAAAAAAVAGTARGGGEEGSVPPYPPLGGAAGAGANGAGGAFAGVAGLGGAGAPGEGAAGRVLSGGFGCSAAALASVSSRATTVWTA